MSRSRTRAVLAGGGLGLLLQTWLLTGGTWSLFARRAGSGYFDAQAEAWLDGHWWIPESVAGIEGIVVDGRTQIYFGPFPALLRLPAALVADLGGQLSVLSMLAAAAVTIWAAVRLLGQAQARWPHRGSERFATWVAALLAFAVPAGTTSAFLASRTLVYHEAEAWGAATALLALSYVVDAVDRPTRRAIVLAVLVASACALSRVSVALGPVAALGLLALLRLRAERKITPVLLAPVVPVAAMALVNVLRFGTLFSIPFQQQVQSAIDPTRTAFFEANGGGFFNLRFLPTTVLHYLQPFGIRPSGWFPFVEFPPHGRVVGSATFDLVDRTASVPATMPALTVLALVGAYLVLRRGPVGFRVAAIGAVLAAGPVLVFGYVAHRYLADFLPALVLLGVCGLAALCGMDAGVRRRVALAVVGLGALAGIWANVGLGLLQQRLWGPQIAPAVVSDFVGDRLAIERRLDLADPIVYRTLVLPERVRAGEYVVLGDCDAVYLETGVPVHFLPVAHWRTIERTAPTLVVRATLAADDVRGRTVVAEVDDGPRQARLVAEPAGEGRARLVWEGRPERVAGPEFDLSAGSSVELEIAADPNVDELLVRAGDRQLLGGLYLGTGGIQLQAGTPLPGPEPVLCRGLLDQAGGVG